NEIQGDIAFSTLGTTLKQAGGKQAQWRVDHDYQVEFADIARTNKVFTFVLLSSANAAEKSLFFYSRMKGAVEKELVQLNFPNWSLFNRDQSIDRDRIDQGKSW